MSNLEYAIDSTDGKYRPVVAVPFDLAATMQRQHPPLVSDLRELSSSRSRVISVEPSDGSLCITLNMDRIGAKRDPHERRELAHRVALLFSDIDWMSEKRSDEHLRIQMPGQYTASGRLRMSARVAWPELSSDERASSFVTKAMREAAGQLRYERNKNIPRLVGARIVRSQGVALEANVADGCNISTNSYNFSPEQPTAELCQHNIYSPIQQLICFAGAIAMARADDHLEPKAVATDDSIC